MMPPTPTATLTDPDPTPEYPWLTDLDDWLTESLGHTSEARYAESHTYGPAPDWDALAPTPTRVRHGDQA